MLVTEINLLNHFPISPIQSPPFFFFCILAAGAYLFLGTDLWVQIEVKHKYKINWRNAKSFLLANQFMQLKKANNELALFFSASRE